jgi:hypothetical protein
VQCHDDRMRRRENRGLGRTELLATSSRRCHPHRGQRRRPKTADHRAFHSSDWHQRARLGDGVPPRAELTPPGRSEESRSRRGSSARSRSGTAVRRRRSCS